MESPYKIGGSDFSGSIYGLPIHGFREALLDTLMGTFLVEIRTIFFDQSAQMHLMKNK